MWDPFGFSLSSIATHFRGLMNMQWGWWWWWWWWWPLSPPVRPPFQPPIFRPPHPLLSNLFDGSYWHSSLGHILSSLPHRFAIASCFPLVCPSASAFTLGNFDMQISPFDLLRNWINYDIIIKKKRPLIWLAGCIRSYRLCVLWTVRSTLSSLTKIKILKSTSGLSVCKGYNLYNLLAHFVCPAELNAPAIIRFISAHFVFFFTFAGGFEFYASWAAIIMFGYMSAIKHIRCSLIYIRIVYI